MLNTATNAAWCRHGYLMRSTRGVQPIGLTKFQSRCTTLQVRLIKAVETQVLSASEQPGNRLLSTKIAKGSANLSADAVERGAWLRLALSDIQAADMTRHVPRRSHWMRLYLIAVHSMHVTAKIRACTCSWCSVLDTQLASRQVSKRGTTPCGSDCFRSLELLQYIYLQH